MTSAVAVQGTCAGAAYIHLASKVTGTYGHRPGWEMQTLDVVQATHAKHELKRHLDARCRRTGAGRQHQGLDPRKFGFPEQAARILRPLHLHLRRVVLSETQQEAVSVTSLMLGRSRHMMEPEPQLLLLHVTHAVVRGRQRDEKIRWPTSMPPRLPSRG